MNTEKKQSDYEELMQYLEEAQAYETALILFEWDEETLAPEKAGSRTARMQGILSSSYQRIMMSDRVKELVDKCLEELTETEGIAPDGTQNRAEKPALETPDGELTEEGIRYAILKAAKRTIEEVSCIPPEEYRAYQELTSKSTRIWTKARGPGPRPPRLPEAQRPAGRGGHAPAGPLPVPLGERSRRTERPRRFLF